MLERKDNIVEEDREETTMLGLDELRKDRKLINSINWEMTPEEAVRLYLEWGNNWTRGNFVIRGKEDVSLYFVVNTWEEKPVVYLVRRNSESAEEIAALKLPIDLEVRFMDTIGHNKGVYAIDDEVRDWLRNELVGHQP
jgi:hypothetical protein